MATASTEPLPSGEEGDEDEGVRVDDELREQSDQALEEKAQRIQTSLSHKSFISCLPDAGKKWRLLLRAIQRELARREAARSAAASPRPRPPRPQGRQGEPDDNRCERIIQSRCAESSGLSSDSNGNHGLTKSDFLSAFNVDGEAGLDLSRREITSTCPGKPKTSIENEEGKLYEVDESCETDAQPTYLSPKVSRMDNSIDLENLSLEHASTPSRKRKGDDPGASSMGLRSRKVQEVVLLDGDARHSESTDKTTNKWHEMKIYYPSSEHPQPVELSLDDIKCLDPESLLSSPIMNFFIIAMAMASTELLPSGEEGDEVVLLDGDARHSESTDKTTNKRHEMKIYYPSSEHPQPVELSHDDIECLDPESLLSSPIMNFYIMYLQQPMSSISTPRGNYHIFNTYFFSKLEALTSKNADRASYFLKLRRWWKGIDIFQKAYVLLPVHADTHWSLVIICIPSKEDQSGPIILHLDSLKFHRSGPILSLIRSFLIEEWIYLNHNGALSECPLQEMVWKKLPRKIEKETIPVPQQENDYDSGLFVLYYMQRFIEEAPERLRKEDLSMFDERWFQPQEACALRKKMQTLLLELFEEAKPDNTTSEQM